MLLEHTLIFEGEACLMDLDFLALHGYYYWFTTYYYYLSLLLVPTCCYQEAEQTILQNNFNYFTRFLFLV